HPVWGGYSSVFDFHTALPPMLGATLIRDEVIQMGQPCQKRLLTSAWIMVTVDRRIAPPTAAPERSVPVSGHAALKLQTASRVRKCGRIRTPRETLEAPCGYDPRSSRRRC